MPRASTASDPVVNPSAEPGGLVRRQDRRRPDGVDGGPLCSLSYVRYTPKRSLLERVGQRKRRTLTASTAEPLAQTLRRVALPKRLIRHPGEFLN